MAPASRWRIPPTSYAVTRSCLLQVLVSLPVPHPRRVEHLAASRVELVVGVAAAEDAVADEVWLFDALRQAGGHPPRDELDQRRVVQDQPFARGRRAVRLVVGPEIVDCFGGSVRHGGGSLRR